MGESEMIFTEFEVIVLFLGWFFGGMGGLVRPVFIDDKRENSLLKTYLAGSFVGLITIMIILGIGNGSINPVQPFIHIGLIGIAGFVGFWAIEVVDFSKELIPTIKDKALELLIKRMTKGNNDKTDK